jgi:photosystem II stability/assembly factor-like uncharacterized protein
MQKMTTQDKKKWLAATAAAALLTAGGWVMADDAPAAAAADAAAPASDAAAPAATPADVPAASGEAAAEAPVVPAKPMPSEMMPLAPRSMMLGLVNNGEHLVAVGDRGQILISNNGLSWAQVQTPVRAPLTAICFVDAKNGWAVGHDATILHTADGGKTWELQNFKPELEKPYLSVLFLDASTGFAVGAYGLASKTTDGGKTWSDVDAPSIRADEVHFNDIIKLGNGDLFIAGEQGMLGVSTDKGATWEKLASPYDASLFGALPIGDKGAVIYGLRGNVYVSTDVHAKKWTKVDTKTVATFFGGATMSGGDVVLVGLAGEILVLKPATGAVRDLKIRKNEVDGAGRQITDVVSSTLSAVIPFHDGILVAGDEGVQTLAGLQAQ